MIAEATVYFEETSIGIPDKFFLVIGLSLVAFAILFWIIRHFRR